MSVSPENRKYRKTTDKASSLALFYCLIAGVRMENSPRKFPQIVFNAFRRRCSADARSDNDDDGDDGEMKNTSIRVHFAEYM